MATNKSSQGITAEPPITHEANKGGGGWWGWTRPFSNIFANAGLQFLFNLGWTSTVSPWLAALGFSGWFFQLPFGFAAYLVPVLYGVWQNRRYQKEAAERVNSMINKAESLHKRGQLSEQEVYHVQRLANELKTTDAQLFAIAEQGSKLEAAGLTLPPEEVNRAEVLLIRSTNIVEETSALLGIRYSPQREVIRMLRHAAAGDADRKGGIVTTDKNKFINEMIDGLKKADAFNERAEYDKAVMSHHHPKTTSTSVGLLRRISTGRLEKEVRVKHHESNRRALLQDAKLDKVKALTARYNIPPSNHRGPTSNADQRPLHKQPSKLRKRSRVSNK